MDDDEVVFLRCPCCNDGRGVSRANLARIIKAAQLRSPRSNGGVLDLSQVPAELDLTGPLSAATVAQIARTALRPDPPPGHPGFGMTLQ